MNSFLKFCRSIMIFFMMILPELAFSNKAQPGQPTQYLPAKIQPSTKTLAQASKPMTSPPVNTQISPSKSQRSVANAQKVSPGTKPTAGKNRHSSANAQPASSKENLFEGYYKIISSGQHIGFAIQRYEYDTKKKEFHASQFLRIETQGTQTTESMQARSDENFIPLSFEYTQLSDGKSTLIDAQFKNNQMTANYSKDGATKKIVKDLPKGTFLSSFLVYMMMKSSTGLTTQTKFQYQAIAEEEAEVFKGEALVLKEEKYKNIRALKVKNKFKGVDFTSFLTDRGEIIATSADDLAITTELVGTREDAIANFSANEKSLTKIFGNLPEGKNNLVAKQAEHSGPPVQGTKQEGIPPGMGIQLKQEPKGK